MNRWVDFRSIAGLLLWALVCACSDEKQLFKKLDVIEAGISFENRLSPTEDFNIIDYLYFYNGGGVAIGDINADGLPDLYFSGNQVKNKLYLNKGNLKFEDITEHAGVAGTSTWNTGSVMGDVNGDGLLDIYLCAVVGIKNLSGHNELFINNGDNTFSEKAAEYGLDFESYSSSAAFLDYDLDGDLDIYLLNHAIHTPGSFGHANLRNVRTYETGGKLLRNDNNKFVDVSEAAHIYGGINGYGLGVAVADFNSDGYPDIYVGNDFHEDDYLYINNGDGTFTERAEEAFTFTSRFSMGNDAADINHDGYPDLISLDMLAEDEVVIKRSDGDENISILKMRTRDYGYNYQFVRNVMQINQGNGKFIETGLMSGVAATDWSWSSLFSDFDQDGNQDLFISNGIPRRPNDLDYIKYVSSEQIVNTIGATKLVDQKALSLMPSGMTQNYIFKGSGSYGFEDKSKEWLPNELTCSTATALGDLDNDGDLDIIINNVEDKPGIYINQTNNSSQYLKIILKNNERNTYGIGARIYSYHDGILQFKEMYTVRGFQASSEPIIHFGYGNKTMVDSIKVIWPNGKVKKFTQLKTNQTLIISSNDGTESSLLLKKTIHPIFNWVDQHELGLTFEHKEDGYTDFDRLKLLPYQQSDRGPATAIGDINNDGRMDVYFGGSKYIPGQIYVQSDSGFSKTYISSILKDSIKEDVDAVIEDFNKDGKADLFIGTGGADFYNNSKPLLDSYYRSDDNGFTLTEVSDYYENASCVKQFDFDEDGDLDLFVGNESVSNDFGKIPKSYLLVNEQGKFTPFQNDLFKNLGMVTDAVWEDYNQDGQVDLIIVGEWMEPIFLKQNKQGAFEKEEVVTTKLGGLWQSIIPFDIDGDGDMDFILGNWGLNSKFKASASYPMKMYYSDFDGNGQTETIIAIEKDGNYFPLDGFDLLASQVVSLRKKYTSYKSFAGQTMEEILSNDQLKQATIYQVECLASGYLKNEKGRFTFVQWPLDLQLAPIMAQIKYDFDMDGNEEVLVGGNYFGVQPFHGRYGSFSGAVIKSEHKILEGTSIGLNIVNQSVRHFNIISVGKDKYLLVTINNGKAQVYKLSKE